MTVPSVFVVLARDDARDRSEARLVVFGVNHVYPVQRIDIMCRIYHVTGWNARNVGHVVNYFKFIPSPKNRPSCRWITHYTVSFVGSSGQRIVPTPVSPDRTRPGGTGEGYITSLIAIFFQDFAQQTHDFFLLLIFSGNKVIYQRVPCV